MLSSKLFLGRKAQPWHAISRVKKVAAKRSKRQPTRKRSEMLEQTRAALIAAAAEIVGQQGYAACSIAKITARAGVAQGTFYTYFPSRQHLFDELLPAIGEEMTAFIRNGVRGAKRTMEVEERGLRAFLHFYQLMPSFYRLQNEAEALAPQAYRKHTDRVTGLYLKSLERSQENGELSKYRKDELQLVAILLIALRNYLVRRLVSGKRSVSLPEADIQTCMTFIQGALGLDDEKNRQDGRVAPRDGSHRRSTR